MNALAARRWSCSASNALMPCTAISQYRPTVLAELPNSSNDGGSPIPPQRGPHLRPDLVTPLLSCAGAFWRVMANSILRWRSFVFKVLSTEVCW